MDRRKFLRASTLPLAASTAGCITLGILDDSKDSDGDGVPDSEDYAPRDPDVQVESDVKTTARPTTTTDPTTTEEPTSTSTTTEPTTTTTAKPTTKEPEPDNTIQANYEPIQDGAVAYFKSYSFQGARVALERRGFDDGELDDRMQFAVVAQRYPNGSVFDVQTTDAKSIGSGHNEFSLNYDMSVDSTKPFYITAYAFPTGTSFRDAADAGTVTHLCETDRLQLSNNQLQKSPHPDAKDTLKKSGYERISGEGVYVITVSGAVNFGLTVYKHGYIGSNQQAVQKPKEVVFESYESGLSKSLASIVSSSAEDAGASSAREKVSYAVSAIQQLPYVKDSVDDSYNDYNKYPIETLVEAGGDCEDTVILLAATLLAEPFNYGMILIYLPYENPDHIGLGIRGNETVNGSYYTYEEDRYFYQETTGEGWELGELPEDYKDESAKLIPLF